MAEPGAEEVQELVATLEALAVRPNLPHGGDRDELAGRLLAAMRAGAEALSRLSREDARREGPDGPRLEQQARAAVEGGVTGLVTGLGRGLPLLESDLLRLGPSIQEVAARLGTGLVSGITVELGRRAPELAHATGKLIGEFIRELGRQASEGGRGLAGSGISSRAARVAIGTGALLAAGSALSLLRGRHGRR